MLFKRASIFADLLQKLNGAHNCGFNSVAGRVFATFAAAPLRGFQFSLFSQKSVLLINLSAPRRARARAFLDVFSEIFGKT